MLMAGFGVMAAAVPVPQARAYPRLPAAPSGGYIFQDEFDGPAGSAPDAVEMGGGHRARARSKTQRTGNCPRHIGQYRDDRRNVLLDGKSNLVLKAAKDGPTFYSGKIQSRWRGGVGHIWEARIKLDCLTPGSWPAYWLGNDDQGEIDIVEWYGNGSWPSATTVHAKANGGEWKTHNIALDSAWHTWRCQWDATGIRFWKDYVEGAAPYFAFRRIRCRIGRSTVPDTPFIRCSISRLPAPAAAIRAGQLPSADAGRLDSGLVGPAQQMTGRTRRSTRQCEASEIVAGGGDLVDIGRYLFACVGNCARLAGPSERAAAREAR